MADPDGDDSDDNAQDLVDIGHMFVAMLFLASGLPEQVSKVLLLGAKAAHMCTKGGLPDLNNCEVSTFFFFTYLFKFHSISSRFLQCHAAIIVHEGPQTC